jgi:hypothetical protein
MDFQIEQKLALIARAELKCVHTIHRAAA